MSNPSPTVDHILVPRAAIPADKTLSFELFVKVADRYVKVANKDEKIDPERINRYLSHEKDVLYIDRGSLERFMDEKFGILFDMITSSNQPVEERFEWFIRCLELGFVDLKIVRPHIDKFMRIEMLVDWCYEFFRKRELRKVLLKKTFWNIEQAITRRAIFGASLTMNLIMEQSDCTAAAFKSLYTGAIYRDISLSYIDNATDPHMRPVADLQEPELGIFLKHPQESVEILRKYITVDDVTRAIIEQHQELPRGNGFPRGLKRAETFQPAQYLNLADFMVTELAKYKIRYGKYTEEGVMKHLRDIMPEENAKNLPVLLRVMSPIFL